MIVYGLGIVSCLRIWIWLMRDGLSQGYLKDLYLSGLREIRLRQTKFSIYLVEHLSSIQFDLRIFELCIGLKALGLLLVVLIK